MSDSIMPSFGFAPRVPMLVTLCALLLAAGPAEPRAAAKTVLEATLSNGMRVVIVPNAIGPVVSTDLTYLVGSRDDPPDVPGMAHAQEHMMFRGTPNLSTSELGTVATALGGSFNAATSDLTTQYQFTVPAADFDAVLRIESDRMRDVLDAQAQWENERGAIEQEVLRDQSQPGNDFFRDVQLIAYAHTPYGHEGVGTRAAFDRLTGPRIKAFYRRWYAPNNAVLVVAGDVDPVRTLEQVRARFESIPRRAVPLHAVAHFAPLKRTVLARSSTLVYPLAAIGFRLPGVDSADFLPSFVLQGILDSERGPLRALVDSGEALDAEWVSLPYFNEAQLGFATAALRPGADPARMALELEQILALYAHGGIPPELFESTKRRLITGQEASRNSIAALASDWATTIAVDREPSIAREQQLIADVTLAEVNRVAATYMRPHQAIVGALTPSANATQNAAAAPPQQGPEKPLAAQPPVTHLPEWANRLVDHIAVPAATRSPAAMKLPDGITLVVQPETISDSVFLYGSVKTNPVVQEPVGKEGRVSGIGRDVRLRDRHSGEAGIRPRPGRCRFTSFRRRGVRSANDVAGVRSRGRAARASRIAAAFGRAHVRAGAPARQRGITNRAQRFKFDRNAPRRGLPATGRRSRVARTNRRWACGAQPGRRESLLCPKPSGPDLTTIVVVGNVTPAAARRAIEREFSGWRATGDPPDVRLAALPLNGPGDVRLRLPVAQDSVSFQQIVDIARTAPEMHPLVLGNAILGGGSLGPEQSRLFRDLRQNAGLVYSIASTLVPRRQRYQLSIEFACLPANAARIGALIEAEIKRMQSEPVGSFELALAKASTVRQTVIADSSIESIGQALLDDAANGFPFDQRQIDARALLKTDADAIEGAFAAYIHPQNFVRIIEGP